MPEPPIGRLIRGHDAERTRISRRLHDDVSQQLASLSIAISGLRRQVNGDVETQAAISALQQMTIAVAETIRQVSNELHPSTLQHVGLGMALSTLCREYAASMGCPVTLASTEVRDVAADVALCLYRTVEEALRNVQAHARATRVSVDVTPSSSDVQVTVWDNGCGFDAAAPRCHGLGLLIIEERARLLGGECRIETAPQRGTRVTVAVPRRC